MNGVDGVINLAASLSVVEEMQVANVNNLERLAEAARTTGVRYFCQASSIVVYGSPRSKLVDEDSPSIDVDSLSRNSTLPKITCSITQEAKHLERLS